MSDDMNNWQKTNEAYLSAALDWLRLRLTYMIESADVQNAAPAKRVGQADIARATEAMIGAEAAEPPPALVVLSRHFGLMRFEQEILLLCAAMEFDTRIGALCAQAQDDNSRCYPTFGLAMALFDDPAWDALLPDGPLRHWQLIEINRAFAQPLIAANLRADERIVNYLKGLNHLDDRLAPLLSPFDVCADETDLSPSQEEAVTSLAGHLKSAMKGGPAVIQLVGHDTLSKQLVAQQGAAEAGLYLSRLPAELLPGQAGELETLGRLLERESILGPIATYLDAHESDTADKGDRATNHTAMSLHRFLARTGRVFLVSTCEILSDLGSLTTAVRVKKPTPSEQRTAWADMLADAAADSPPMLAGQFDLNVCTIRRIVNRASAEPGNNGHIPHDRLWDACLVSTGPKLDALAQRLEPKATWDDIVLPEETTDLLHRIAEQVRHRSKVYDTWGFREKLNRGLGINALFSGCSGTGKTMAAEVIANDLSLNLYRIDLSGVVNKYIGETEKNLRRLFDAAEDGGAILFFDEADALFGKRSEVKDSHDRYANIEVSYLLQRMESYNGLAILATNMRSMLDEAFLRRLRFIVDFPFPSLKERRIIAEKVFPAKVPKSGLDYDRLARLNLTGGSMNNIAINAAFMAAHCKGAVTMPLMLSAAKAEFCKMERPVKEADFLWQEPEGIVS